MEIELHKPVIAQKLDDDGEPVGKLLRLKPGKYRLRSALIEPPPGEEGARAWLSPAEGDSLYEARNLKLSL